MILPADRRHLGSDPMFLVLIAGVLSLTMLRGWRRLVVFLPVLYLAVCMWESAMLPQARDRAVHPDRGAADRR